jgi:hypothetical protein
MHLLTLIQLRDFVKTNELRYPVVLGQGAGGPLQLLLTAQDLAVVSKDHSAFVKLLNEKAEENDLPLDRGANL